MLYKSQYQQQFTSEICFRAFQSFANCAYRGSPVRCDAGLTHRKRYLPSESEEEALFYDLVMCSMITTTNRPVYYPADLAVVASIP